MHYPNYFAAAMLDKPLGYLRVLLFPIGITRGSPIFYDHQNYFHATTVKNFSKSCAEEITASQQEIHFPYRPRFLIHVC
jgi:hypothetical protein